MNNHVLIVSAYGKALVLVADLEPHVHEFLSASTPHYADTFSLDEAGCDYAPLEDGVYVGELALEDDGPGDYPGTREVCTVLTTVRRATEEEWAAHLHGEWPWEHESERLEVQEKAI